MSGASVRIDIIGTGRQDKIHAGLPQGAEVVVERPGIGIQILMCGELHGVYEDRHHHCICCRACLIYQCKVAFVQVAHGRHKRDRVSAVSVWSQVFC